MSVGRGETIDLPVVKEEMRWGKKLPIKKTVFFKKKIDFSYLSSSIAPCQSDFGSKVIDQDEGYYECVMEWARREYRGMKCKNGINYCLKILYVFDRLIC